MRNKEQIESELRTVIKNSKKGMFVNLTLTNLIEISRRMYFIYENFKSGDKFKIKNDDDSITFKGCKNILIELEYIKCSGAEGNLNQSGDLTFKIYDLAGKMVYSKTNHFNAGQHLVVIPSELNSGQYMLSVDQNDIHLGDQQIIIVK